MDAAAQLELLLRGFSVGALAVTGIGLWLSGASRSARWAAVLFCLSITAYVLINAHVFKHTPSLPGLVINLVSNTATACVWLFVVVVFEDRKISPMPLAPVLLMLGLGGFGVLTRCNAASWVWSLRDVLAVLLSGHGLYVIVQGWRGDLVESRRALRGPFLTLAAGFAIVQTLVDAAGRAGLPIPWGGFGNALIIAALCVAGAYTFLQAKASLFGAPALPSNDMPAADLATLDRLQTFMEVEQGWRQESLTIAAVAQAVGAPEHRVRRLINDHMGHRNFQAFVNAYRIEAAKWELSQMGKRTIATIAFDLGFGSLGPFNRAFRAATGVSPREWRRQEGVAGP